MESNFPVPSKGALRILRQIVYASSLGTAAAIFLAEPRRQICTARKVLDNKRKLQAARSYVSTAALAEGGGRDEDPLTYWGRHLRRSGRADFEDFPCSDPVLPSDVDIEAVRDYVRASSRSRTRLPSREPPGRGQVNNGPLAQDGSANGHDSTLSEGQSRDEAQLTYWGRHLRRKRGADLQDFPGHDPVLPSGVDIEAVSDHVGAPTRRRTRLPTFQPVGRGYQKPRISAHIVPANGPDVVPPDAVLPSNASPPADPSRSADFSPPPDSSPSPGASLHAAASLPAYGQDPTIEPRDQMVSETVSKAEQPEESHAPSQPSTSLAQRSTTSNSRHHANGDYLTETARKSRLRLVEHPKASFPAAAEAVEKLMGFIRDSHKTPVGVDELEQVLGSIQSELKTIKQVDAWADEMELHINSGDLNRAVSSFKEYVQYTNGSSLRRSMLDALQHLLHSVVLGGSDTVIEEAYQLAAIHLSEQDLVEIINRYLDRSLPKPTLKLLTACHAHNPRAVGPVLLNAVVSVLDCLRTELNRTDWPTGETKMLFLEVHEWYIQFDRKQDLLQKDLRSLLNARKFGEAVDLLSFVLPPEGGVESTPEIIELAVLLQMWSHETPLASWVKNLCHWMEVRNNEIMPWKRVLTKTAQAKLLESWKRFLELGRIKEALGSLRCLAASGLPPEHFELSPMAIKALKAPRLLQESEHLHQLHGWVVAYGIADENYTETILRLCYEQLSNGSVAMAIDTFLSLATYEFDFEGSESKLFYSKSPSLLNKASKLADHLFDAAIRSSFTGSTSQAKSIYRWMLVTGISTQQQRCNIFRAHNAQREYDQIVEMHCAYPKQLQNLPKDVRANICMASAAVGPIYQALQLLEEEWTSGLRAEPRAFSILLERVWKSTRNVEQVKTELAKMQTWMGREAYTLALINCVIGICVKARKSDEAQQFLELLEKHSQPNIITYGHAIFDKAISGDWKGVVTLLQQATDSGLIATLRSGCGAFFNRVLDVFRQSHNAEETFDFLREVVDVYGVPPDQTTSDIAIEAFMLDQQLHLVPEWIKYLVKKGFRLQLTELSFTYALRKFSHTFKPSHDVLLGLYNSLRSLNKHWVLPGALDLIRNAALLASEKSDGPSHNLADLEANISGLEQKSMGGGLASQLVQSRMIAAMSSSKMAQAVRIYKDSVVDGLPLSAKHLETAVTASIQANNGDFEEAYALINEAQAAGVDITQAYTPLLNYRVVNAALIDRDVAASVLGFYKDLDAGGFRPNHSVAVTAASRLLSLRRPNAAIKLMTAVANSEWAEQKPLDIAAMSVFVRAYAAVRRLDGIKWAVYNVLDTNMRLDAKFINDVKLARGSFDWLAVQASTDAATGRACKEAIEQLEELGLLCWSRKEEQRRETLKVGREIVELGRFVRDAGDVNEAVDMFMRHGKAPVPRAERPKGGKWVDKNTLAECKRLINGERLAVAAAA